MGYKSSIWLILDKEAQPKIEEYINTRIPVKMRRSEIGITELEEMKTFFRNAQQFDSPDSCAILFHWKWIYWFDTSDNYGDHIGYYLKQFLASLPEKEYFFIRQGEAYSDRECLGSFKDSSGFFDPERMF